jgi:hypothetical protein
VSHQVSDENDDRPRSDIVRAILILIFYQVVKVRNSGYVIDLGGGVYHLSAK